jgi:integrase/recombinase XerD
MDRTISSFLQHLIVEKGFSRNTSDAYRNDLGQFWEFLQNHKIGHSNGNGNGNSSAVWSTVDINVLNKYVEDLRVRKGYRDTTTARKVASIKSFFGFLSENSIITEDPTESLGSPRVGRTLPKFLPEEDVTSLLDTAYKSGTNEGH